MKILVIEDEPEMLGTLKQFLEDKENCDLDNSLT